MKKLHLLALLFLMLSSPAFSQVLTDTVHAATDPYQKLKNMQTSGTILIVAGAAVNAIALLNDMSEFHSDRNWFDDKKPSYAPTAVYITGAVIVAVGAVLNISASSKLKHLKTKVHTTFAPIDAKLGIHQTAFTFSIPLMRK